MQQEVRHNAANLIEVVAVNTASHIAKFATTVRAFAERVTGRVLLVSVLITPLQRAVWLPVT